DLRKRWPKPEGLTPMDAAMQEAVRIVTALPPGSDVSVVLFTDGDPNSGILRPDVFPEVKAEFDRQLKEVQLKNQDRPASIVDALVARTKAALLTPGTEEWAKLYAVQLPAEFRAVLAHAAALKQARARFVTVDYDG